MFRDQNAALQMLTRTAAQRGKDPQPLGDLPYASQALFELEMQTIFKNQWACVGRVDEFKKPGDYVALTHGNVPILVVKQASGEIEAMLNICRHRMARLVEGRGNLARFVCPYHAWSYARDGALVAAPGMPPEMDKSTCGLTRIQVETWMGFVYVNPDPKAPSLSAQLGALDKLFKPYPLASMKTMRHDTAVWNCNWKLAVDNFLESYHFPAVHHKTLGTIFPTDTLKMTIEDDAFAFYEITFPEGATQRPPGSLLMDNPNITPEQERVMYTGAIFPNHVFTVQYDQIVWMRMQPLAVDRTLLDFGLAGAFNIPDDGSFDPQHPEFYLLHVADQVNLEDQAMVEGIQRNCGSGLAQPSFLHHSEHGMISFARYLDRQLRT